MRFVIILFLFVFSALGLKAQDSIPPTITLLGDPSVTTCQYYTYKDAGYDLTDNVDKSADIKVEEQGSFLPNRTNAYGVYSLRYKATDKAGNVSYTAWRSILVLDHNDPNCKVGVPEYSMKQNLTIYPNPTKGKVEVNIANSSIQDISLTDLTGKNIPFTVTKPFLSSFSLSLSGLPPGIYLLHVKTDQGTIVRRIYLEQ